MQDTTIRNEETKAQIRRWLEAAIRRAKNPDPRDEVRRKRQQKAKKVAKQYGL